MTTDEVLLLVEAHLLSAFGPVSGRAGVSFLGTERIDVLRFGPAPYLSDQQLRDAMGILGEVAKL